MKLLTRSAVARQIGVGIGYVDRLILDGRLAAVDLSNGIGRKRVRISDESLSAYLASTKIQTASDRKLPPVVELA